MLRPGHDTSCPYKNRCEFFNFTELRLDAIALLWHGPQHRLQFKNGFVEMQEMKNTEFMMGLRCRCIRAIYNPDCLSGNLTECTEKDRQETFDIGQTADFL